MCRPCLCIRLERKNRNYYDAKWTSKEDTPKTNKMATGFQVLMVNGGRRERGQQDNFKNLTRRMLPAFGLSSVISRNRKRQKSKTTSSFHISVPVGWVLKTSCAYFPFDYLTDRSSRHQVRNETSRMLVLLVSFN